MTLPDLIETFCRESHVPMAAAEFGDLGVEAILQVMKMVKELYKHVEPERISGQVVVIHRVYLPGTPPILPAPTSIAHFPTIANQVPIDIVLEVGSDGLPYFFNLEGSSLQSLAVNAVVYRYCSGKEEFFSGTQHKMVPRLDGSARSQFCVPTFSNLRDALRSFAVENIKESTCYIFQQAWKDPKRLFFRAKPEKLMNKSLTQFLKNRLGGEYEIWPEQNVDDKHPVDIQVKPRFSNNRVMIIEIKWLGDSVAEDGHITAQHREPRAQEGVGQLAQYLDWKRQFAPTNVIQGYYVIVDGRRNNLRVGATSISQADGMHFENQEFSFDSAVFAARSDFDKPYRMFARPICD